MLILSIAAFIVILSGFYMAKEKDILFVSVMGGMLVALFVLNFALSASIDQSPKIDKEIMTPIYETKYVLIDRDQYIVRISGRAKHLPIGRTRIIPSNHPYYQDFKRPLQANGWFVDLGRLPMYVLHVPKDSIAYL